MICSPCREKDHSHCEDLRKPDRLYDSCYCNHRPISPEVKTQPQLGDSVEG